MQSSMQLRPSLLAQAAQASRTFFEFLSRIYHVLSGTVNSFFLTGNNLGQATTDTTFLILSYLLYCLLIHLYIPEPRK